MSFDPNARLDPSQVEDVGRSGLGGRGVAFGGGGLGLAGIVVYLIISALSGGSSGNLGDLVNQSIGPGAAPTGTTLSQCRTGADANRSDACRAVGYVNSVQAYWRTSFAASNRTYTPSVTVFFQD